MPDSGRLPAAPDQAVIRLQERLTTRYQARISGALVRPATPADWADLPPELAPGLAAALIARGVPRLYAHQREAFDLARAGRHLVVATPTASGKTLCYNLPVLDAVLRDGRKALYLFPTKALAQDQVAELTDLGRALTAAGGTGIRAYTFDGDTPGDARKAVRTGGDLVLSNPDMLHQAILPHHTKWAQFFEGLAFVVVDELHSYRGVFGSHVANVFRRLRRICRFYGVSPTFIFTSATIANPAELAQRLCGEPVTAITRSGAPQGERYLLLWNPPVINPDLGIRASARSQTTRIARMAVKSGLKAIVFARSRLMVEVITKYLKDVFDKDPRRPPRVLAYRGGYLPSDRRAAEQALRAGRVDLVVSTSALELGVDIGALDVAILNGYPGTIAATWQRLGRAGRRLRPSLGVLVATSDPLDQYLVRHPEFFFDASPEHARIHPDQLLILLEHVRCAAFELPFRDGEHFGAEDLPEMLSYLRDEGVLQRQGDQWFWVADSYPANAVSLRSVAEGNFVVIDTTGGAQTIIAEVDWSSAPGTIYVGAIYMIQSQPYQVERLDWPGRKAFVTRTRADYYTDAIDYTRLKILDRFEGRASGAGAAPGGVVAQGEVHLVRRYPGYKKIRYYSHDNIGYGNIDLPDQELHTTAVWWQAQPAALEALLPDRQQAIEGFLGAAYALHHVAALRSMAELHDLGRAVGDGQGTWFAVTGNDGRGHLRGPDNALVEETAVARFEPTLFLYDNYPGGVGLSAPLYDAAETLVRDARDLVAGCGCSGGCPACVGPVLPGDAERAITPRAATLRVLGLLEGSCDADAAADHGV
ncbi:DEAD/DEAH box helicase [uncultured Lamprocystis sp.]|jgi:DEAD/DEAH box helicase domain-containing protein|uniref:DEAD/DEAH box helicase n=1 Tax=uncultured Lamprocystis sp. TaxID=543132 RepID=UPI0025FF112E|nr:DEAD/DEAH box helicase [uncultured Lamprocystis sp.]